MRPLRTSKSPQGNVIDLAAARERLRKHAAAAARNQEADPASADWCPVVFVFPVWFGYGVAVG